MKVSALFIFAAVLGLLARAPAAWAEAAVDASGRLERLPLDSGWLNLKTNVVISATAWKKTLSLAGGRDPSVSRSGTAKTWRAELVDEAEDLDFEVSQTVQETKENTVFGIKATARGSGGIEGAFFFIDLPAEQFAGGSWQIGYHSGVLPLKLPEDYQLCDRTWDNIVLCDAQRSTMLKIALDRDARIIIQDSRKWHDYFSVLIEIHDGNWPKGQSAELRVALRTSGHVDDAAAHLTLEAGKSLYSIQGIGGNYCYNIESPVTRCTLDNLHPAFARTEMSLDLWHPPKSSSGHAAEQRALADQPGGKLRREFELMRELNKRKIPYIASVWRLPAWMYQNAPESPQAEANHIAAEAWPELLEYIGSYLVYAKERYQGEPGFFSFNEPDLGINVQLNEQEYCEAVKLTGAHLKKLGLKTKILLGDTASARGTHTYVEAAAQDEEALRYAGALSFHSWGGALPEQYEAWTQTAARLNLPLFVSEAGVDASAWHNAQYQSFDYGAREMAHYQELFLFARPQAVLYWEYSGDYALLRQKDSNTDPQLTERFCFQKHWTEFIPPGSTALKTSSDKAGILFTAFRHLARADVDEEPRMDFTFNLANPEWTRQVTLEGIPSAIKTLNAVRTARGELFKKLEPVTVKKGKVSLELPAQSLTTLTTMDVPELEP